MGRAGCSEDLSWERRAVSGNKAPWTSSAMEGWEWAGPQGRKAPRDHVLEMVSCSNNNELRHKCSLALLLSGSPPSLFKTTIVHKTSFYTSATSQDDFEYWTHLWQINVCACACVSFVYVYTWECEYAYVCLCVVRTHTCACTNTCVNVHVCINARHCRCIMNVHMRVHMHAHARVWCATVCVYTYMHTHSLCVEWTCMHVHACGMCIADGLG